MALTVLVIRWPAIVTSPAYLLTSARNSGAVMDSAPVNGMATLAKPTRVSYDKTALGLSTSTMLDVLLPALMVGVIAAPLYGRLADRIGLRPVFAITAASMILLPFVWFPLLNTGNQGLMLLGFVLLFARYAGNFAIFPVFFSQAFPVSLRFSGMAIGFTIGTIAGSAFAPAISAWLLESTGTWVSIAAYMAVASAISLVAGLMLREARAEQPEVLRQESGAPAA